MANILVKGKAENQISYLRYLDKKHDVNLDGEIAQCEKMLQSLNIDSKLSTARNQLFGIEGYIAERYFSALGKIYPFPGRKTRGRDWFNSALNYGYGILYNEIERQCLYAGLDPNLGLYHSERYGKPSLVLDLIEEFRVPFIDSVVFPLFAKHTLNKKMNFKQIGEDIYQLSSKGKKVLVEAVYTRFNKKILWGGKNQEARNIIRHQILMLTHHFLGKRKTYLPFSYDTYE